MVIQIKSTQEVVIEKDIQMPSFFKNTSGGIISLLGIYGKDNVINIDTVGETHKSVCRCKFSSLYQPEKIIAGEEITEEEFNETLNSAINSFSEMLPAEKEMSY